ncbi:MAG: hypothetical protein FWE67_04340, partial [Planctomycetaceae bacterium]|nr:hypothetical protein [Planctomycetaceae bacterium]
EEILKIIAAHKEADTSASETPQQTGPPIAVTALTHESKGEQIIVLYRELPIPPQEIINEMIATGLPKVWIPQARGFLKTDSIPVLGTGKLDLAAVKKKAAELF